MSYKATKTPDSDQTARHDFDDGQDMRPDEIENEDGLQTSLKSGKHSSVEKLAASRPEYKQGNPAKAVPGAHGDGRTDEEKAEFNSRPGEVSNKALKHHKE